MKEEDHLIKISNSTQSLEELSTEPKQSEMKSLKQSDRPYFYLNYNNYFYKISIRNFIF